MKNMAPNVGDEKDKAAKMEMFRQNAAKFMMKENEDVSEMLEAKKKQLIEEMEMNGFRKKLIEVTINEGLPACDPHYFTDVIAHCDREVGGPFADCNIKNQGRTNKTFAC